MDDKHKPSHEKPKLEYNKDIVILGVILMIVGMLLVIYTKTIEVTAEITVTTRPYWQIGVATIIIGFVTTVIGANITPTNIRK